MAKTREMGEDSIQVVKFEAVQLPTFEETKTEEYVKFGKDNGYPQYLLELFNRSSNHNAIVTGKVHYIKGRGFYLNEGIEPNLEEKIKELVKNINYNDSADDLLYKVTPI
jgi:hypothetical protein